MTPISAVRRFAAVTSKLLKSFNAAVWCGGSAAVPAVVGKLLILAVRRFCGGWVECTPIPLYAPRRLMARSRAYEKETQLAAETLDRACNACACARAGWTVKHDLLVEYEVTQNG